MSMMQTSIAASCLTDSAAADTSPRVLMFRSCRPDVFAEAVRCVRAALPGARVTVLTHPGHRTTLQTTMVDEIVETPGARFGPLRVPSSVMAQLGAFSHVVIPQMAPGAAGQANVYALALRFRPRTTMVFDPVHGLTPYERWTFLGEVWRSVSSNWLDVPAAMTMALAAVWWPRRALSGASPRRVLCVITSWGVGGAQRQLAELARRVPASVELDIFVLARADGDFSSRHLQGRQVSITYSRRWPSISGAMLDVRDLCRARRYDVVHTWLFLANVVGIAGARLAGVPRAISSVRNLSLWKRTWAHRPWFRLADALTSRSSDVVTVNATPLVADHARWSWLSPERIRVIPNGLDECSVGVDRDQSRAWREALGFPPATFLVGTVGRLAPEKDHVLLLRAWRHVHQVCPGARLVIVGDGPLAPALRAEAARLGGSVVLAGQSGRVPDVMAALDLFVLPSRIEGFANVLIEAALSGTPIVATDVGGARDVVQNEDDLVAAGDERLLARRIVAHAAAPGPGRERAAARRDFVRSHFSATRMVERWLSLYHGERDEA